MKLHSAVKWAAPFAILDQAMELDLAPYRVSGFVLCAWCNPGEDRGLEAMQGPMSHSLLSYVGNDIRVV